MEKAGDTAQAKQHYLKSLAAEALGHLGGMNYLWYLDGVWKHLGDLAKKQGEIPEAILRYEQIVDLWSKWNQEHPDPRDPYRLEEAQGELAKLRAAVPQK
jgi:hypothetical protein